MKLEFDPQKSETNKIKHGIDFEEAMQFLFDPYLIEIQAKTKDEPRSMLIAKKDGKHWSAIITRREEIIRFISVRRARKKEIELYEST